MDWWGIFALVVEPNNGVNKDTVTLWLFYSSYGPVLCEEVQLVTTGQVISSVSTVAALCLFLYRPSHRRVFEETGGEVVRLIAKFL